MEYQEKKCIYQVMYLWVMFARSSTHIILMSPPFLSLPSVVPPVCPSFLHQLSLPPSLCLPFTLFLSLSFPKSSLSYSSSLSLPLFLHSSRAPSVLLSLSLSFFLSCKQCTCVLDMRGCGQSGSTYILKFSAGRY